MLRGRLYPPIKLRFFVVPFEFEISPDAIEIVEESTGDVLYEVSADEHRVDINVFAAVYKQDPEGDVFEPTDPGDLYSQGNPPFLPIPSPLPENATIDWQIASGSGGTLSASTTDTDEFGEAKTTLTLDTSAGSEYTVEATLASFEYDGVVITRDQTFETSKIVTVSGYTADITVDREVDGNPATDYPADGSSQMTLIATFWDQYGNLVRGGTPVDWLLNGQGRVVSEEFLTDSTGKARIKIESGIVEGDQEVLVIGDFFGVTETITNTSVAVPTLSSSNNTLDIFANETATITATFTNVPDDTEVHWFTSNGTLSQKVTLVSSGTSTNTIDSMSGQIGTATVTAAIGNSIFPLTIQFVSTAPTIAIPENSVLAGDTNTPGSVSMPTVSGGITSHSYEVETDVLVKAAGFPDSTAHVTGTGESSPNILGRFRMDQIESGNILRDSVSGIEGVVQGAIVDESIKKEGTGSLSFDGLNNQLTLNNHLNIQIHDGFRVTLWENANSFGGNLISKQQEYQLMIDSAGFPVFSVTTDQGVFSATFPTSITLNNWHQITGEYKAGNVRIIVDGVTYSQKAPGSVAATPNEAAVGQGFQGNLDSLVFADGPATHHDLQSVYYPFDELGPNDEVFDFAANNNGINQRGILDTSIKKKGNGSFSFDGTGSVIIPDSQDLHLRQGMIFRLWVRPQMGGGSILGKDGEFTIALTEDLEPEFTVYSTFRDTEGNPVTFSVKDPNPLPTNQWTQIEATFTSCEIRINDTRSNARFDPEHLSSDLIVGTNFTGHLDEFEIAKPSGMCIITGVDLNNDIILDSQGEATINIASTGRFRETSGDRVAGVSLEVEINPHHTIEDTILLSGSVRIARLKASNGMLKIDTLTVPRSLTLEERKAYLYNEVKILEDTNQVSQMIPTRSGGDQDNYDQYAFCAALILTEVNEEFVEEKFIPVDLRAFDILTEEERKNFTHKIHKVLLESLKAGNDAAVSDLYNNYLQFLNYVKLKADPEFKNVVSLTNSEDIFDDLVDLQEDHGDVLLDNFEKLSHDDQLGKETVRGLIKAIKRGFWGIFITGEWTTQGLDSVQNTVRNWVTEGIVDGTLSREYGVYVGTLWGGFRTALDTVDLIAHPYKSYQLGKQITSTIFAALEGSEEARSQLLDMVPILGTFRLGGEALDLYEEGASDPAKYFDAGMKVMETTVGVFETATVAAGFGAKMKKIGNKRKTKRKTSQDSGDPPPPPFTPPAKKKQIKDLSGIGKTERIPRKGAGLLLTVNPLVKRLDGLIQESLQQALQTLHNGKHTRGKWGKKYLEEGRSSRKESTQLMWYGNAIHEITYDFLKNKIDADPALKSKLDAGDIQIEAKLEVDGKTLRTDIQFEYASGKKYVADISTPGHHRKIKKYEKSPEVEITVAHNYKVTKEKRLEIEADPDDPELLL